MADFAGHWRLAAAESGRVSIMSGANGQSASTATLFLLLEGRNDTKGKHEKLRGISDKR